MIEKSWPKWAAYRSWKDLRPQKYWTILGYWGLDRLGSDMLLIFNVVWPWFFGGTVLVCPRLRWLSCSPFFTIDQTSKRTGRSKDIKLRYWKTRTHCCWHKCFLVYPRAQHLLRTQILRSEHKKCFWFCVSATNVSQFVRARKRHEQQCFRNNVSSFATAFKKREQI